MLRFKSKDSVQWSPHVHLSSLLYLPSFSEEDDASSMDASLPACLRNLPPSIRQSQSNDPKHWNSIIKYQAKLKNDTAILTTYSQMESLGISADTVSLPLVLKACSRVDDFEEGKRIHYSISGSDLVQDVRVGTALVDFYCKCGFSRVALKVFDEMRERDLVSWNALIKGYVGCSLYEDAILLFLEMQKDGLKPNSRTMVALLSAGEKLCDWRLGREIHAHCLRNGLLFDSDPHLATALVGFYAKFDISDAHNVFKMMGLRNVVSWNQIMTGYFEVGDHSEVLKLFLLMLVDGIELDSVTLLIVIQSCEETGFLQMGTQIHQLAIKFDFIDDSFVLNTLLNMYSNNECFESAYAIFHSIPTVNDTAIWNSMIYTYIEYEYFAEAVDLYIQMREKGIGGDVRTCVIMLSLCGELHYGLSYGRSFHAYAIKMGMAMDVAMGNALLSMYAEENQLEDSRIIFYEMEGSDVIGWNTMIFAYAWNNMQVEAGELFSKMRESEVNPNSYTMISLLETCKENEDLKNGKSIHGFAMKNGIEVNVSLNTALSEMYMVCGEESSGIALFEGCRDKDLVSWNALIANYVKNDKPNEALSLFNRMASEVKPNSITVVNVLGCCAHLSHLSNGKFIHGFVLRRETLFGFDLSLSNALITMYTKCGDLQYAEKIFRALPRRNIISYNAMITGYGTNGRGNDAITTFLDVLKDGFEPNNVTFLSVLSACSHSGLLSSGFKLFDSMVRDFGIAPELSHYGCMVDMLGRGGHVGEAVDFVNSMPIEPDASILRALLSALRASSNLNLAETISEKLIELEPTNYGNYVLISNIYAASGIWRKVAETRAKMRARDIEKSAGSSWVVIRNQVHYFTCGGASHPESENIYEHLISLSSLIKEGESVLDLIWNLKINKLKKKIKKTKHLCIF